MNKIAVETTPEVIRFKQELGMTNIEWSTKNPGLKYTVFPKKDGYNGGEGLSHFSPVVPEDFRLISLDEFNSIKDTLL